MSTSNDSPKGGLFRRKPKDEKPKKDGRLKQIWSVFQMTRRQNPNVVWWMLLAFLGVVLIALLIGLWFGHPIYSSILGAAVGVLAAMFILARMAERAAFAQIEGQPGAVGAALGTLRRGWAVEEQPVAIEPRTQDVVFRAVGRGGVVLVSEGPPQRASKLLAKENKKTTRVLPNVPVHLIQGGNADGQVPLRKLPSTVTKIKPTLTKAEVLAVRKRLTALGGASLPIPKGIDPTRARPDRKAMKGR
ncbi:DUF4191 domain-containing protein [Saxibacter everestensis]|uniref:DUF4191 domain-containing protein n=1 Tax=Saxibacter everestensis TaxID=2909229 RepID=A0ABY8QWS8_9MICO|nr:DUF4191 domain-containing protein [Brevibacteriaceae bacterium ZFBP1038]